MLSWHKALPAGIIDIASSGMPTLSSLSQIGVDTGDLPLWGDNLHGGYSALKEHIAGQYGVEPERIVMTSSASMANFVVMSHLLNVGDCVMVETPTYSPLVDAAHAVTETEVIPFERVRENRYAIDPDNGSIEQHRPKLLVMTNPHNPSGVLENLNTISQTAERMAKHGGTVLVDEIFLPFAEGGERMSAAAVDPRVIVSGSLTKVWGLGGLRIGWIIAPTQTAAQLTKNLNYMMVLLPFAMEHLAHKILSDKDLNGRLLRKARDHSQQNRAIVTEFMKSQPELEYIEPDAGVITFVRFRDGRDSEPFCRELIDKHYTYVTPGRMFGVSDCFRLGYGCDRETLNRGLNAISSVLRNGDA